ncbi:hypothetical protein C8R43DRAFT_360304 [Mycena crocata]|nr:hypothetical protein C8R43DRAFT_360304 [Mycena crocata]
MHFPALSLSKPIDGPGGPQKHFHRRSRTLSSVSIPAPGSPTKITVAALVSTSSSAACTTAAGAFTLTGSARVALRGLGSPTNTPNGRYADTYLADPDDEHSDRLIGTNPSNDSAWFVPSVPSISRTASPFEGERAPILPGWGARRTRSPSQQQEKLPEFRSRREQTRIHPGLEKLERTSRLTKRVVCAGCKTVGSTFPRCTRCAQMWCSRACRMSMAHKCQPRRAQTSI